MYMIKASVICVLILHYTIYFHLFSIFVCTIYSSRRKRSSNDMVFTSEMVHILPGYPKKSPDDPLITLLAFYSQLPQGFSDNMVNKDVLKAIMESDMSRVEGSIGGTILSVQFLFTNTDTTGESDEESEPALVDYVIVAASVCCGLLLVMICTLALGRKRCNR